MKVINQIVTDFKGIVKVCGFFIGIKWLLFILLKLPQCFQSKNLQPADKLFGEGPICVKAKYGKVSLIGGQVFSSIREIWVRNVYLMYNFVQIPDSGLIVDLGANVGAFTMLALANSTKSKVISVEPNAEFNKLLLRQVTYNNFNNRILLQRYFIGAVAHTQKEMLKDPGSADAEFISQKEFIELNQLKNIDFLKCDIEGSEFEFVKDTSLLEITYQLAIEIHDSAGDRNEFISKLIELGFNIGPIKNDYGSCIVLAKKKN